MKLLKGTVHNYDVHGENETVQVYEPNRIVRDKINKTLHSTSMTKMYKVVYDKRVIRNNFKTYPYGY